MKPILLLDVWFNINEQVDPDSRVNIANSKMVGSGMMSTYVFWNFNVHAIVIDPDNPNIFYSNVEKGYMQPQPGGNVAGNVGFFATLYTSSNPAYQTNTFQSYYMDLASGKAYVFYLLGIQQAVFYIENCSGVVWAICCPHTSSNYVNGADRVYIIGSNAGNGMTVGNVIYVYMDEYNRYSGIDLLSDVPYIYIDMVTVGGPYPFITSQGSTAYTVDRMKIGELIYISTQGYATAFTSSTNSPNVTLLEIGKYTYAGINGGGISGAWALTPSTPSVPLSGTATVNVNPYSVTVYLNGGSVTQVRVTRNGAEYMLFNSAAGVSMSGQGLKLGAGDTTAVTYGSPPTWVWMA